MTVMTPTNAVSTTTGTALLVRVPLLHSKKPYKRQNFGLSLCSQQLPQVLLDSTHPMLKIFKRSLAVNHQVRKAIQIRNQAAINETYKGQSLGKH